MPFFLFMVGWQWRPIRPAFRSLWGLGLLAVFLHCLVDYPMQQRPALAAFFFAMLGMVYGSQSGGRGRTLDDLLVPPETFRLTLA